MKNQKYLYDELENGLRVLRLPIEIGSVMTMCLADTGSRYEKEGVWGIAHFFEHMVFKGTEKYPDAKTIATTIDGIGADFNAFTGKEYTGYYIKSASEKLGLALDMISDMLLSPKLDQKEIDKERGVIIEELNMYVDSPTSHVADRFDSMVYAESGLGHNPIGNKETINKINREDFAVFLKEWYALDNLLLVLAGDKSVIETENCLEEIQRSFGKLKSRRGGRKERAAYLEKDFKYGPKLEVIYRETEQAHFVFGWPGLKIGDDDEQALSLLKIILGGNMSSRLFTEIREKRGLCYYVSAFADGNLDGGTFGASAGVSLNKIEEALKWTIEEFVKIANGQQPISELELVRAKEFIRGQIILGLENSGAVARMMGFTKLLEDKLVTPQEELEKMLKVDLEKVQAVAEKLIKSGELRLALIGPYKKQEVFEKIINY